MAAVAVSYLRKSGAAAKTCTKINSEAAGIISANVDQVVELTSQIKEAAAAIAGAESVFVLTGAGISAESGVPTFRGCGAAAVWREMPFEQLSSAEMVEKDLPLVWEWFDYRRAKVSECEPNAAHIALARAASAGWFKAFALVTQNVDGLHRRAGSEHLIELHGNLHEARCLSCGLLRELNEVPAGERPPVCPNCSALMRPNVVLFGEMLPAEPLIRASAAADDCGVCLVVGTSALVFPAADLPRRAGAAGALLVEINPEETPLTRLCDISLRGTASEIVRALLMGPDPR